MSASFSPAAVVFSSVLFHSCLTSVSAVQSWAEQPRYQEVNPFGNLILPCVVNDMRGQCRWEKDGSPVGMFPTKYEWAGTPETGDCSLRVLSAELEYDDGVLAFVLVVRQREVQSVAINIGAATGHLDGCQTACSWWAGCFRNGVSSLFAEPLAATTSAKTAKPATSAKASAFRHLHFVCRQLVDINGSAWRGPF